MNILISFLSGLIFAVGLAVSGMINPRKVLGFLDLFGKWDNSLAFVMGGAVLFNIIAFKYIQKRNSPLCTNVFELPKNKIVDKKLIVGSSMFGVGWGLIGICPGPGIVNLAALDSKIVVFVLSMLLGMFVFKLFLKK